MLIDNFVDDRSSGDPGASRFYVSLEDDLMRLLRIRGTG